VVAIRIVAIAAASLVAAVPTAGLAAQCNDLLAAAAPEAQHLITADDLVGLRDFGPMDDGYPTDRFLGLSPDGTRIALELRRAMPSSNDYCLGIVIVDLKQAGSARLIATGGEYIRNLVEAHGFPAFTPGGQPALDVPVWSHDGKWIAYLRQDRGSVQAWRAAADGSAVEQGRHVDFDVEAVAWSDDDKALQISGRPGLAAAREAIRKEARTGYRYDDRYLPMASNVPLPRTMTPTETFAIDLSTMAVHSANAGNRRAASGNVAMPAPVDSVFIAAGRTWTYWAKAGDPNNIASPLHLFASAPTGEVTRCRAAECDHIAGLWIADDRSSVVFLNREGRDHAQTGLYTWAPGMSPRRIVVTDDVLTGCELAGPDLVCGRDGWAQPRRLVAIDLQTGQERVLFDPNPGVAGWRFGKIQRLYWRNDRGIETYGDLVLPPDHEPGQRHPLIVVQYVSRGFLRGGTGDEYPIELLASHGYAVLSFQVPPSLGTVAGGRTWEEIARRDRIGWANRWSVESALEQGVAAAIATGTVDKARVGLTGLSDGATTVQFALIHSAMFKAAAISSCCSEASTVGFLDGPVLGEWLSHIGYPTLMCPNATYWKPTSLHLNADKIRAPILMQIPDDEYLGALESFTALKEARVPVDMYVYPDENHVKWQPAHRRATYLRSLQWFDYWLRGLKSGAPIVEDQYRQWDALRQARTVAHAEQTAP